MTRATCFRGGVALWLLATLVPPLAAQEPRPTSDAAPHPPALRYFRVEVPLGHEEAWKKLYFGFEPHPYPIEQADFDRLLRAASPAPRRSSDSAARLATLRGEAQLVGDALVGRAEWEIVAEGQTKSLVSLAGCNLAITAAHWADGRAAQIGSLPDGSPVLVVEQPGKLLVEWSLRGSRESDDVLRFDLQLPRSQNSRFDLRLPSDARIAASRGLVAELPQAEQQQRTWSLELGSLPRAQLTIASRPQAPAGTAAWLARQQCDYSIDEQGLRLTTELSLNLIADSASASILKLQADDGLHLTGATVDGKPAEWEVSTVNGSEQILLTLEPLSSAELRPATTRKVLLSATGEFPPLGACTLPAVRPLDVVWQASLTTTTVGGRYELQSVDVAGGRLLNLLTTPAGRVAKVEFYEPGGRMTLACGEPAAMFAARSTYVWRFSPDGLEARYFAELSALSGVTYDVAAALLPGWELNEQDVRVYATGVESAAALANGRVSIDRRQLRIVFDAPLTSDRPLRLEISARRRSMAAGQALSARDLAFVRLHAPGADAPVGVATTQTPYRVQLSGADLQRLKRDDLASAAAAWIPAGDAYAAFRFGAEGNGPSVGIVRDPPRVEADVLLAVDVDRQQLTETYDLHIRPDTSGIDRLRVSFWPPRTAPLAWTMTATDELPVVEFRRLHPSASAATGDAPEVWEVEFHQRQTSPLVLHATRAAAVASRGQTRVTLAAVDEATSQSGRVVIRAPYGVPLTIASRRLRAVAAVRESTSGGVVRGAFRFDPARAMPAGDEWLSLAVASATEQTWAWHALVESQITAGAAHAHRATWLVQNNGLSAVRLRMPANSQLRGATLAGMAIDAQPQPSGEFAIALPADAPLIELGIDYETAASPLGVRGTLAAAVPQINIPVLRRSWRAALPVGYAATLSGAPVANNSMFSSVGQRLFGPLYRRDADDQQEVRQSTTLAATAAAAPAGPSPTLLAEASLETELPNSGEATVYVYRHDFLFGLRLASLLVALALAWWLSAVRVCTLLGLSLLAGGVALAASPPLAAAAAGVFLGLPLGLALRALLRQRPAPAATTSSTGETSTATAAVQLAAIGPWLFALAIAPAHAADDAPQRPYPVWIPVDEKRVPSGEVYLPRAFYAELQSRARAADQAQRGWMLLGASYDLQLAWQGGPPVLAAEALVITYDLHVTEASPRATLPLPFAGAALGSAWATLDGEPMEIVWQPEQQSLELPLEKLGQRRLELRVQPAVAEAQGQMQIDMPIPRCIAAKLRVTAPIGAPAVAVAQCQGALVEEVATLPLEHGGEQRVLRWRAALGSVDRLAIRWPRQATPAAPPVEFTVDQMSWLKLAGEPRLETKFRCAVKAGALRELWLVAPADLKLVSTTAKWEAVATPSSTLATYRLILENPADKEAVVRAEFQLPAAAGVGRMLLPQVHLRDAASVTQATLAVSLPAGMKLAPDPALRPLPADDFARRWGEATAAPAHILQLDPTARQTPLLLRPLTSPAASREKLLVGLTQRHAKLQFTAEVDPAASPTQLYEITTPAGFVAQQISVTALASEADPRELLMWSSSDAGRLRLFLQEPIAEKLNIQVAGTSPLLTGKSPLPLVRLAHAACVARSVELYRDASVVASVVDVQDYAVAAAEDEPLPGALGRRLATLTDDEPAAGSATCSLQIAANRPQVSGRQVTRLVRHDDAWQVQVDLQLQIADGLVDALRLELPAEFAGQLALAPPLAHRVSPIAEVGTRELVISPTQSLSGAFQVQLTLRAATPGAQVQVPDVRLRDFSALERFVIVPRTIDAQNIQWQVDRLLALGADRSAELGLDDDATTAYRVVGDPFRAELRAVRRLAGVPLVRLADVRFAWRGAGGGAGWATFDLEPAGLNFATIAVPAGDRLIHVQVGELPAQVQPISPQRWRVALWPQGLPQRVDVFYEAALDPQHAGRELLAEAPIVEGIAVERTLWTLYASPAAGRGAARAGGKPSALQQDLTRLRSLTEVLRLPRHVRVEATSRETADWFAAWESRWQSLRSGVARGLLRQASSETRQQSLADLQAIDADHEQIVADLDVPASAAIEPAAGDAGDTWRQNFAAGQPATRAIVQGSSASMVVDFAAPSPAGEGVARWLLAIVLAMAGVAILLAKFWLPASDWHLRSGRAIGVAVGIAWALWLSPAWVGWLIVVYCLLPLRWPEWRGSPAEAGSAIVVRSGASSVRP